MGRKGVLHPAAQEKKRGRNLKKEGKKKRGKGPIRGGSRKRGKLVAHRGTRRQGKLFTKKGKKGLEVDRCWKGEKSGEGRRRSRRRGKLVEKKEREVSQSGKRGGGNPFRDEKRRENV